MNSSTETFGCNVLKAMGNEERLRILNALRRQEMSVGELEKVMDLSQSALSQHLAILRREGIVKTRRKAQTIFYSIKSELVTRVLDVVSDFYNNRYSYSCKFRHRQDKSPPDTLESHQVLLTHLLSYHLPKTDNDPPDNSYKNHILTTLLIYSPFLHDKYHKNLLPKDYLLRYKSHYKY